MSAFRGDVIRTGYLVGLYIYNYTGCLVRFYADLFGDEDDEMEMMTIKLIMLMSPNYN